MPPPIPVPIVSRAASLQPAAAPNRHSASIAAVASLSTNTGRPSRSAMRSRNGRSRIGRWTVDTATPRSWSISDGMPRPTASTSPPAASRASRTASTIVSSTCWVSLPRANRCARWWTFRLESTIPASNFVPPRSTPITRPEDIAPPYSAMPEPPQERPPYTLYRSRPRLLPRNRAQESPLDELRGDGRPPGEPGRRRWLRLPGRGKPWSVGRVVKLVALAIGAWLVLSLVLFMISATFNQDKVSDEAKAQLTNSGYPLWSANTILVLGSDARPKGSKEPGANSGPSRSDSILLVRTGGGHASKLSILRDTVVPIPGHGLDKVNAAYAYGGAALSIKTISDWLGIPINHVIEINFERFPDLVDAMGGITYKGGCVFSKINGGNANGGYTLRLKAGTHHIDGKQALALARTRKNLCNPREDDRTRAARQQKILTAM